MKSDRPSSPRNARIVLAHAQAGVTTKVKSTLIASSRQGLIDHGHQAAYEAALGPDGARAMRDAVMTPQWLPLETARQHYAAADAIGLSVAQMHAVGNVVGARIEGAIMGGLARFARTGGLTPWTPLGRLDQIWGRMYEGGSIGVYELGPKDARIEMRDNPLADIRYWRVALTGLVHGVTEVFAKSVHSTLDERDRSAGSAAYVVSWV